MRLDKEKNYLKREIKFFKKHPELIDKYALVLKKLQNDPFEPSLKLHKLQGNLEKFHAVRLTYEYRIVLVLMIVDEQVILVDIGTHDEVY
ncbi:type II toxin-antitoxin system RelE/ParE family toxin [Sulfurimonas sp.]|uniref:type II toxin-antitoxin system RelE/ParE family toxin n=1 Tax=Sulfurimonas sp. TaxID=2022749 RepID=UPI003D0DA349